MGEYYKRGEKEKNNFYWEKQEGVKLSPGGMRYEKAV